MKQKIIPIVSVVVGILAFFLTYSYLRGERRRLEAEYQARMGNAKDIQVVVASQDIASGEKLSTRNLGVKTYKEGPQFMRAVMKEDAKRVVGRKLLFRLKKNQPVLWSDIQGGTDYGLQLSSLVDSENRMRAVTIPLSGAASLNGMVRPNDFVDILGTFELASPSDARQTETTTITLLQCIRVLATGRTVANRRFSGRAPGRGGDAGSITLMLKPDEAEFLIFAQQTQGRLYLTLRNPRDIKVDTHIRSIDFKYLKKEIKTLTERRQRLVNTMPMN